MSSFPPLEIGPIRCAMPVVLAPMAGVTNAPFRSLCREFGAALYVSEMVSARGLVERHDKTKRLADFADDEPVRSIQLYGTDPDVMGAAVSQLVREERVDHIDLNFGCPARKVTRHGGGAVLPVRRRLFAHVVSAAVDSAGSVPVTVKMRVGIDDDHTTFLDAGRAAEDAGAAAVALHARTAQQLYAGDADWSTIGMLKEAVTSIPVLGNGDIWDAHDAVAMMRETGCDGVVVGRGCLGRPWLFRDLAAAFAGDPIPSPPDLGSICTTMERHATLLAAWFGEQHGLKEFRKHTGWYLQGFVIGSALRRDLRTVETLDQLDDLLAPLDPTAPFPVEALRMPRGHTHGPKPVTVPEGWFDHPDVTDRLDRDADLVVSGG